MEYKMNIAGVDRALPLCKLTDELYIGAFVIFGDPELTTACAKALLEKAYAQLLADGEISATDKVLYAEIFNGIFTHSNICFLSCFILMIIDIYSTKILIFCSFAH